ncbi:MAG: enoyl-CoA hydratase/isomerase family protein [Rhizobium leguminosarum]|nr:enoyl-CoA hydratase/isomerase family protein [Rhizobium leguminosarum]
MASGTVRIDVDGHVATLTISRPEKLNALDLDMLKALADAADEVEANANVRAAILTGEGKGFSAGGDIKAWGGMLPQEFGHLWVRHGHRIFERLATLRMPLIAALNGHALEIGLPETGLGMVPGWSGTQRLVRRFGAQTVRRMALGGEIFTAEEARLLGIVDAVVPTGNALAAAREYAGRIAARGPAAIEIAKLMIASANGEDNGTAVEALGSILAAKTGDLKEGVASFSEKRPATFKGEW